MARDWIELGPTPPDEDCAQVGQNNFYERAKAECAEFKRMMEHSCEPPQDGIVGYYSVKSFPHDFGTYYEVVAVYDDNDERSLEWALLAEDSVPSNWDEQARETLARLGWL